MKKILAILFIAVFTMTLSAADKAAKNQNIDDLRNPKIEKTEEEEKQKTISTIFCYLPNRVMDFLDMFTIDLKGGCYFGAGFHVTKYFGLGGQVGANAGLYKDYNRQYGIAFERGYQAQVGFLSMEDVSVTDPIGTVKEYWRHGCNFPDENADIYKPGTGARDYWSVEVYAYALVGAKVALHPLEIADFFAGLLTFDFQNDDNIKLKTY